MAKFSPFVVIIIITFVISGTCTTLFCKWTDHQTAEGIYGEEHEFSHAFVQTWFMFLGEFFCGWVYYGFYYYFKWKGTGEENTSIITRGYRDFSPFLMVPPCCLDLLGTTSALIGLNLTYASSYQMLRGSVILFVGILSVIFLGRHLIVSEIVGMLSVIIGLVIVGSCDYFLTTSNIEPIRVIIGDLVIIVGQFFTASMMVYQQKVYCTTMNIPVLQAVGFEGFFGLIFSTIINFACYYIYVGPQFGHNPRHVFEDPIDACIQMANKMSIFYVLLGYSVFTTLYNYSGLTITKELSALTRKILDSVRTVTIWVTAVLLLGQNFIWETVLGFIILLYGLFLYNGFSMYGDAKK